MRLAETEFPRRDSVEDWREYLVAPPYVGAPAWASLAPGRGWKFALSVRADEQIEAAVEELRESVPGLTESAAVRVLLAIGVDALRAVSIVAPSVVEDAVREKDAAALNAMRLTASVCPLVYNAVEDSAVMVEV